MADERREWIRIEDALLLEYRLSGESVEAAFRQLPAVTPDVIAAADHVIELRPEGGEAGEP